MVVTTLVVALADLDWLRLPTVQVFVMVVAWPALSVVVTVSVSGVVVLKKVWVRVMVLPFWVMVLVETGWVAVREWGVRVNVLVMVLPLGAVLVTTVLVTREMLPAGMVQVLVTVVPLSVTVSTELVTEALDEETGAVCAHDLVKVCTVVDPLCPVTVVT